MKKEIIKLGLVLAVFAIVACIALALVYQVTGPAIEGLKQKQLDESLKEIFPKASKFEEIKLDTLKSANPKIELDGAWKVIDGDAMLGIAIQASGPSYGGPATMIVGIGINRRIVGSRILVLNDTPGLGANATNPNYFVNKADKVSFLGQYIDKPVSDPFVVKDDIIAISASTITSKSLTDIVKESSNIGIAWIEANTAGGK